MKSLVDMIATEVLEEGTFASYNPHKGSRPNLPPIRYDLELIEKPDGSYEWVE